MPPFGRYHWLLYRHGDTTRDPVGCTIAATAEQAVHEALPEKEWGEFKAVVSEPGTCPVCFGRLRPEPEPETPPAPWLELEQETTSPHGVTFRLGPDDDFCLEQRREGGQMISIVQVPHRAVRFLAALAGPDPFALAASEDPEPLHPFSPFKSGPYRWSGVPGELKAKHGELWWKPEQGTWTLMSESVLLDDLWRGELRRVCPLYKGKGKATEVDAIHPDGTVENPRPADCMACDGDGLEPMGETLRRAVPWHRICMGQDALPGSERECAFRSAGVGYSCRNGGTDCGKHVAADHPDFLPLHRFQRYLEGFRPRQVIPPVRSSPPPARAANSDPARPEEREDAPCPCGTWKTYGCGDCGASWPLAKMPLCCLSCGSRRIEEVKKSAAPATPMHEPWK